MIKRMLIIGLMMSGLVVSQNEISNGENPVRLVDYFLPDDHYCIVLKCTATIEKCKTIGGILTPFCDKHIAMIEDYKVLDVCGGSYRFYVKQCKDYDNEK